MPPVELLTELFPKDLDLGVGRASELPRKGTMKAAGSGAISPGWEGLEVIPGRPSMAS